MEKGIRLYFHCYADGEWAKPVHQYFQALIDSKLDSHGPVYLGLVGSKENRAAVCRYIDTITPVPYEVVTETEEGWEQVTLKVLYNDVKTLPPFKAFYAHTKGAAFPTPINNSWREDMIYHNIGKWKKTSSLLNQFDAVGIFWLARLGFFAGNFWWVNSEFLSTLPECTLENRHMAESWLRTGPALPRIYDLFPGFPSVHPPTISLLPPNIDRENKETMIVTFRCDANTMTFRPGRIYETELTPHLERLLRNGSCLVLIDPPSVDQLVSVQPVETEVLFTLPNQSIHNNLAIATAAANLSTPNPVKEANPAPAPSPAAAAAAAAPVVQVPVQGAPDANKPVTNPNSSEGNSSN